MLPTGVIFLGPNGEIALMNRSATSCLAKRDGLLATREGLLAEQPHESSLLAKTILEATSTGNGIGLSTQRTLQVSRRTRPALQVVIVQLRMQLTVLSRSQPLHLSLTR
jgi:hypothetical protein